MNIRNNTSRKMAKSHQTSSATVDGCEIKTAEMTCDVADIDDVESTGAIKNKQRKKREELSSSATKSIKKEFVDIVITFN